MVEQFVASVRRGPPEELLVDGGRVETSGVHPVLAGGHCPVGVLSPISVIANRPIQLLVEPAYRVLKDSLSVGEVALGVFSAIALRRTWFVKVRRGRSYVNSSVL